MELCLIWGIGFPLMGTVAGAALVFFLRWDSSLLRRAFSGAAAGIMGAASLFGLLLPALRLSPWALAGLVLGLAVLIPVSFRPNRGLLILLAVVLHNIPEGMAAGVSFGSWLAGAGVSVEEALAVGVGIGLQNVPDGAMAALPLYQRGMSRGRAITVGAVSGLVEPAAAILMLLFAEKLTKTLPALMGFAAGAMLFVVGVELIPGMEMHKGKTAGAVCFVLCLMGMMAVI